MWAECTHFPTLNVVVHNVIARLQKVNILKFSNQGGKYFKNVLHGELFICSRIYFTEGGFTVEIVCHFLLTVKRILLYSDVAFLTTQELKNKTTCGRVIMLLFSGGGGGGARVLQWA
jgi:hypothetical protein